ncbi:hypothetical protein KIH87_12935 [Paraneptunicella aestuarii]|uniref:hypothetical protein n=1 Tax=Paraneptunicella aestuarii TaxID=2831148 RepID=UPI001E4EA75E|nr:hypothetical protein [Paraneptunicella aestuarii]UAA37615.1 hypothetical protein KIH87_12935 [Paraneptunicella aestuarii]
MSSVKKVWNSFCREIEKLNSDTATIEELFTAITRWLSNNKKSFPEDIWSIYKLDFYTELDVREYYLGVSEDSVSLLIERLRKITPHSVDRVAMIVRDVLWDCSTFKTHIQCPNCKDDDLRIMVNEIDNKIVLACDICLWAQFEDGKQVRGQKKLRPAKKFEIDVCPVRTSHR